MRGPPPWGHTRPSHLGCQLAWEAGEPHHHTVSCFHPVVALKLETNGRGACRVRAAIFRSLCFVVALSTSVPDDRSVSILESPCPVLASSHELVTGAQLPRKASQPHSLCLSAHFTDRIGSLQGTPLRRASGQPHTCAVIEPGAWLPCGVSQMLGCPVEPPPGLQTGNSRLLLT